MAQETADTPMQSREPLLIGRKVPSFTARSTVGMVNLEDFRGKWLILFAHPADFTPVCTSEFIALQKAKPTFDRLECALLGLSVDSIYSHVAWVRNIQEKFGIQIEFPIVEDISMAISSSYQMIDEASTTTATVRAVFFIDPEGILRAKIVYPMQVGRSVEEILRTLQALQSVDTCGMSAGEGWNPGQNLMPMAPTTISEAQSLMDKGDRAEWYYSNQATPVKVSD